MDFAAFQRRLLDRREAPVANAVCLATHPSTNDLGRRIAAEYLKDELPVPATLVVAYEQTSGRGRWGRGWASPPGLGVYASLVLPLTDPDRLAALPLLVAVGLARVVNRHLAAAGAEPAFLKWPNDLVVAGRKLAGILIDAQSAGEAAAVVVGFGVNVGQGAEELAALGVEKGGGATSLAAEMTGPPPPLAELTWELVGEVCGQLDRLDRLDDAAGAAGAAEAARSYADLSVHRPGDRLRLRTGDETVEGTFLGFDHKGYLRLEVGGEERRLAAGEVSAR